MYISGITLKIVFSWSWFHNKKMISALNFLSILYYNIQFAIQTFFKVASFVSLKLVCFFLCIILFLFHKRSTHISDMLGKSKADVIRFEKKKFMQVLKRDIHKIRYNNIFNFEINITNWMIYFCLLYGTYFNR